MSPSVASNKQTVTYRTVRGLDIKLDYVLPDRQLKDGEKVPVVVWFHGGGLVQGSRGASALYPHLKNAPNAHDVALISPDYRLAPQTKFPEILSDLTSLFTFLLSPAFAKQTENKIDFTRMVTMGSSAGGWLSLLSGLNIGFKESKQRYEEGLLDGRVRGVVGIYPITSVEHEFWHTKQHPVSYYGRVVEKEELKVPLDPKSDEIAATDNEDERNKMYTYMIQEGILQDLLLENTGVDPSAFTVAKAIKDGRTVEPLPPIYLVHGTSDDKVPHSQSVEVFEALKEKGFGDLVTYEEKEGLDHSYDAEEKEEMKDMWDWVTKKLRA